MTEQFLLVQSHCYFLFIMNEAKSEWVIMTLSSLFLAAVTHRFLMEHFLLTWQQKRHGWGRLASRLMYLERESLESHDGVLHRPPMVHISWAVVKL